MRKSPKGKGENPSSDKTGKIENLSRANLCLAHGPLELDDEDLDSLKLYHLS